MCHEASLRAAVCQFCTPSGPSPGQTGSDWDSMQVLRLFAASDEHELVVVLRRFTLLTALCAAVSYVVPEDVLPEKHLIAPLFLRASRKMLSAYVDYDLERPDSSSLAIRLFYSSALHTSTGTPRLAFHILNEAGLIAMRMRLYDEASLQGLDPVEEKILRNAFWQLYVCDKTALVTKDRPVTIHEPMFDSELSLEVHSQSSVSLLEHVRKVNGIELEVHLSEGFHIIRRLWTIAAQIIQAMERKRRRDLSALIVADVDVESTARLSEAYFEMIALTSKLPFVPSSDADRDADQHPFDILQRQRTSYLITLHSVKIFVLNSASRCGLVEIVGLTSNPRALAMRQIELAQDFINVLESVPFLHLRTEGEHCVSLT